ncbi:MAG: 50S ribosomal protein L9 [Epsilonproteobacteria bacterium]|nr:MAG: 50S ribosomal protein L9 [Campylobacterota bacterium]RLA66886.1 MAG: 50S ribosomal protein L9 [Campylobacterota bacterium]
MKVILTKRVPTLGNIGELANVSQGYGRNYLIPNGLAVLADDSHKKEFANHKRRLTKKIEEENSAAMSMKKKIDGMVIELIKKVGANGKLFGTVTTAELSKLLGEKEIEVEKKWITLSAPIKSTGSYTVDVKLFTDVIAQFEVKVMMDPKQAQELKEKQALAEKSKSKKKESTEVEEKGEVVEKTEEEKHRETVEKIIG